MSRPADIITGHRLYDRPAEFHAAMLRDIDEARHSIFLETYKFAADAVGGRFRDALTRAAARGVKVKLLLDSWGVTYDESYFADLIRLGGEVRFFRKIKISFDFFTKNHRRNHRKFLIVDDHIGYIGSANITGYSMQWRESVLRLSGSIALTFKRSFLESYRIYNRYIFNKFTYKRSKFAGPLELVEDMPSIYRQRIKTRIEKLISKAKSEILIETPYFLPGHAMRRLLMDAARRGVHVRIIMPRHSDVRAIDLLSGKYYGMYHSSGIELLFYTADNLHAKLLLFDNETFALGSPNMDYRSFRFQHEVMLFGKNNGIREEVQRHLQVTLEHCIPFDFVSWQRRPRIEKVLGWMLLPFRHLF